MDGTMPLACVLGSDITNYLVPSQPKNEATTFDTGRGLKHALRWGFKSRNDSKGVHD